MQDQAAKATKQCKCCGAQKLVSCFGRDAQKSDGLRSWCRDCTNAKSKGYYASLDDERRQSLRATRSAWSSDNKEKQAKYVKSSYIKHKAKRTAKQSEYVKNNLPRYLAHNAARRASLVNATPAWASQAAILEVYELAEEFRQAGFEIDVDHIVPIKGKTVCGLHSEHNLRPCLASINRQKSNRSFFDNAWN